MKSPKPIAVVGVGSWRTDDRVGWDVIEHLQQSAVEDVHYAVVATPILLLEHADQCRKLIVVDACSTGAVAGTITRIPWPDPRFVAADQCSSHGWGVVEALQLLTQLGRLPQEVVLLGVERDPEDADKFTDAASPEIIQECARRVLEEIEASRREPKITTPSQPSD